MNKTDGFKTKRVLIASGGTGGHFYPGLALANELRARGGWEPLFLVKKDDISISALQKDYYPYAEIDIVSLPRGFNPFAYASFFRKLAAATLACARILADFRPVFVVGTGSYVSFPAVAAAALKGVPSMIHDSNAVLGLANRLSGRFATTVALGLPVKHNAFTAKSALTGTPIREIFSKTLTAAQARLHFALAPDIPVLLIFGGSQGSRVINQAILETAVQLTAEKKPLQLLHITGKRDHAEFLGKYKAKGLTALPGVKVLAYCEEMALAYAAADIVVSRSGGGTISELAYLKKPAILIPLPGSPGDHQKANAEVLACAKAAVLLEEGPAFTSGLCATLRQLLEEPARMEKMKHRFPELGLPDPMLAAGELRMIMERHLGG